MKNKIEKIKVWAILVIAILGVIHACTKIEPINTDEQALRELYAKRDSIKWAQEDSIRNKNIQDSILMATENAKKYAAYIEDLKMYKKSKHPIMFGGFSNWNPESPDPVFQLTLLPDSVDMVSIWGGGLQMTDAKREQLREVQAKGTKVIIGWIVENVGDQIYWEKSFWPMIRKKQ